MPWWVTPALIGGAMFYLKSKTAAAARWFQGLEADAKKLPIAVLLTKISTGNAVPAPPASFQWKKINFSVAASPFAAPQDIDVHVLEAIPAQASGAGISAFLTEQQMVHMSGAGWMEYHLTKEALQDPLSVAPVVQLAAIGGSADKAIRKVQAELRAAGYVVTPVDVGYLARGDFAVTCCGKLYAVEGVGPGTAVSLREIHPTKGVRRRAQVADVVCAFGVRKEGLTA